MHKKYFYYFLFVLLLADLTYSFLQYYNTPLDGDMAGGIVPAKDVEQILKDPFGISVITENAVYPNPNRYFAHWTFYTYFNNVPLWLQHFVSPIDSVYLACAIAKTLIQILILTLLAFYIIGQRKICNSDFLIAAVLIIPLFQANGYRSYMGIIDPSTTYTFFYALPCAALLLFYLPFFYDSVYKTALMEKWIVRVLVFALAVYVVFDGALNPGVILIITLLFGIKNYLKTDKNLTFSKRVVQLFRIIPKTYLFFFGFVSLLSLYALYIGVNNSIFSGETVSIIERYSRIPKGIIAIITQKIGYPILLIMVCLNLFLLYKNRSAEHEKTLHLFGWIGLFSLCYILLLPLGGYKDYRPNILRYDTIMPITIGLIFIYAKSSWQLLKYFRGKNKYVYLVLIVGFTFIFSNADRPGFRENECEKLALKKIAESNDKVVLLESSCTVLSWDKITDPASSTLNGQLLKKWKITNDCKQYYQYE
ncbi:hypothetical protein LJC68_02780 [Bacteroidales bacterium OttesenSCG-928-B11]|nr:hypothetical protein [Bacteroidales bacterium OttesenSCG-928-E04]MDL2308382.1 hypothetical protein [Bacteroidales bacterium OttesenSCG-928-C03]MDL2311788.1 hypothetical protein [Bacteroidales bacterium OttesenSCG-928-B11]MDL2326207.1 hypothetical protein [Bacteroidales bacterium OttesenSCG-928-A14]